MKEKNKSRKQQLKWAKEMKDRKKSLYKDVADFMVTVHLMQIPQPVHALKRFLSDGWKGYHQMKGRKLIGKFEDEVKRLRGSSTMMFYQKRSQWADDDTDDRILSKDKERLKIREQLVLESDSLMNRLIELSFDLDFED